MNDRPRDRKELYERIARGGRDAVTLEEMIRHGFWAADQSIDGSGTSAARLVELRAHLDTLRKKASTLGNVAEAAEALKQKRMAESRQRRLETKQRRLGEREAKKAAWKATQATSIGYLGEKVSAGLGRTGGSAHVPIADASALATFLGITLSQLRFLAYDREVSTVTQYRRFAIPKRSGGERIISAPRKSLKAAQHVILEKILSTLPVGEHAHGFVPGRSIVTNARPHVGASVVVNVDLRDFFPTVTYRRIKGLYEKLGYCEEVATILALLCTEPDTVETTLDGVTYYVARSQRRLPQGAPTSPALTNLLCRTLDRRIAGFAKKHRLAYTRYADDLTLSGKADAAVHPGAMLTVLKKVAKDEGFVVHPDKVHVQRRARRQEVTGVVVNETLAVDRRTLRRFRALLFQIEKDGVAGKRWGNGDDVLASAAGFANYVAMIDPTKGAELRARVRIIRERTRGR